MKSGFSNTDEWQQLSSLATSISSLSLRDEFNKDSQRFDNNSLEVGQIFFDYSKNLIDADIKQALVNLASVADLEEQRRKLFKGEKVNVSENRPALHSALRDRNSTSINVDGRNILPVIESARKKMGVFTDRVRDKQYLGSTGKTITDVVNIGIGGSHLGPEMTCHALKDFHSSHLNFHFVSNVDFSCINEIFKNLSPETTLFIISSKSFSTEETLANANEAKKWVESHLQSENCVDKHFVAVSSNQEAAIEFGIAEENIFPMWDWVGGRYSVWSAVGLPLALAIGMFEFERFLEGAQLMDAHFQEAPLDENMPVMMALLGIWYNNFLKLSSHAVVPYSEHLSLFTSYLQQCDMESSGKFVSSDGVMLVEATGPIIWGGTGTNSQHAFFQLLHQGSQTIPVDFIGVVKCKHDNASQHKILLANMLAQTEALMLGKSSDEVAKNMLESGSSSEQVSLLKGHRASPGNRPSTTILLDELTPYSLGQLIALYEHKVFCQGVIWQINSFDQWGVELGKQLSAPVLQELLDTNMYLNHDGSTNALMKRIRASL